ncbi:ABC transporter ATP-binding protein [Bacillus sp. A301a_S52]|jgi:ABC-2 type transport system ATP-binding protein|nr:ABC transporter ATP-binding protein [Bacillus sp. A301a_S52]
MSLKLTNVSKIYNDTVAVDNLTLHIEKNQMFGVLGANGAGKTTTFRMILGLIHQTEGEITWKGQPLNYHTSHLIGYLPEERGLYPKLTVKQQLIYLGRLKGMKKHAILLELEKWIDKFKISGYINKKVGELSKGNQQKVQFITSVIHSPELLILDEPFSGLDPLNVELLKNAVKELKEEGKTILFSSHRMEHVEELCENLCILHDGKPVVSGHLLDIKRDFGKKNVVVSADFDLSFLTKIEGVINWRVHTGGLELQVASEEVSQKLFKLLQGRGFVRKFHLEEPSLHDIFIEKAGASYE